MNKLFFSPHFPRGKAANPYCDNFIDSISGHFSVVPVPRHPLPRGLDIFRGAFKADYYILNWLEGVVHLKFGTIQGILGVLSIIIIHIRKKRILWMFHNIHPHGGETYWSKVIQRLLFKWSYLIVSHSQEASDYAKKFAKCPVVFKPHPVFIRNYNDWTGNTKECDFFIWGDIYPYKGVVEFINNKCIRESRAKIYILGKAVSDNIRREIEHSVTETMWFDNRRAEFDEIAAQCKKAKYVLFPYIGDSISSSGVLMDTLLMGGIPLGPNRGAFADLQREGCCITYNDIEDVLGFITKTPHDVSKDSINAFINNNSWDVFGEWVVTELSK